MVATRYEYLRERLQNNLWLGKEILFVNDYINGILDAGTEWLLNVEPIRFLYDLEPIAFIRDLFDGVADLGDVVLSSVFIFLETSFGVNRAFNSKVHRNLEGTGNAILSRLITDEREISIYKNSINAYNTSLNLPFLSQELAKVEGQLSRLQLAGYSAVQKLLQWEQAARNKLEELREELMNTIESLAGEARRKARRVLSRVQKILETLNQRSISEANSNNIITPRGAIVPVVAGIPTVAAAAGIIGSIASFLLSNFLLKAVLDFPAQMLGALVQVTTSVVLKFLGGAGAEACRYLCAGVLRTSQDSLPAIFAPTGMFAGAWVWLMAYAPYIIIAAIIIILAIRASQTLTGEILYVFGAFGENAKHDMAYARLVNADVEEVRSALLQLGSELRFESNHDYSRLLGFALDKNKIPTLCLDMTGQATIISRSERDELFSHFSELLQEFEF